jgi:hypothetical protein
MYTSIRCSVFPTPHMRSPWRLFLGTLCVLLVLLGGTISATHSHANDSIAHGDCGLCAVAHATAKAGTPFVPLVVALVFIRLEVVQTSSRPRTRLSDFALFTRPPPVDSSLA